MSDNYSAIIGAKIVGMKLSDNGFMDEIFIITPKGEKLRLHDHMICDQFDDAYIGVTLQE